MLEKKATYIPVRIFKNLRFQHIVSCVKVCLSFFCFWLVDWISSRFLLSERSDRFAPKSRRQLAISHNSENRGKVVTFSRIHQATPLEIQTDFKGPIVNHVQ